MLEFSNGLPPSSTLQDQLCFALSVASRAMTTRYRLGLDGVGLTYPQYLVMLVLWEHRTLTVSKLSARLQLSTGTLSPLLKRLEKTGLLTRQRSTRDERLVQLTVTEAGMTMLRQTEPVRADMRTTPGMTADEVADLIGRLIALSNRMRAKPSRLSRGGSVSSR